ncbi:hypothetical protein ACFLTZ_05985 [Chloroflexota bacterium]
MKRILLIIMILLIYMIPALPARASILTYPELKDGVDYYQTTFPAGLQYSPGWYGTFAYAPAAYETILFDDDWYDEWGRCIFSMPSGVAPSGEQGGTSILAISKSEAEAIMKSYSIDESIKPFDSEITGVMTPTHYYTGVWAGEKLKQKWSYDPDKVTKIKDLTERQVDYITATKDKEIKEIDLARFDPDRYWVGNSGNWSDNATHWSTSSGGAPGASKPTSADDVYFDANSFSTGSQTITVDETSYCLGMDWTGVTDNPTFHMNGNFNVSTDAVFSADMTQTYSSGFLTFTGTGAGSLTTNGLEIAARFYLNKSSGITLTLNDDLTIVGSGDFILVNGNLDTGDNSVVIPSQFIISGTASRTLNLGSSDFKFQQWSYTGSNLTVAANTANMTQTGVTFAGSGITTYHDLTFENSDSRITGSNTFNSITLPSNSATSLQFTDGTTTTAGNYTFSGTSGNVNIIKGSGVGGWSANCSFGTITADWINVSHSTVGGGATFTATGSSINGGNNTGWTFPSTVSTQAASGVTMDADGVTGGLFNGTITDMGGATGTAHFEYGLTVAYGANTTPVAYTTVGAFNENIPTALTPGATYHYRAVMNNGVITTNGTDQSFTFTMPSVSTTSISNVTYTESTAATITGNVTNMGVASNTYRGFEYGENAGYGDTATETTTAATGAYSSSIVDFPWDITLHARAYVRVGSVYAYGSDTTATIPNRLSLFNGMQSVTRVVPMLVLLGFMYAAGVLGVHGFRLYNNDDKNNAMLMSTLSVLFIAVGLIAMLVAQEAIASFYAGTW